MALLSVTTTATVLASPIAVTTATATLAWPLASARLTSRPSAARPLLKALTSSFSSSLSSSSFFSPALSMTSSSSPASSSSSFTVRCTATDSETLTDPEEAEAPSSSSHGGQTQVTVRRRPPVGASGANANVLSCGPNFSFRVDGLGEEAKPQNMLEEIVWWKDVEIGQRKEKVPFQTLVSAVKGAEPARDFVAALRARATETDAPALIAEVKKASPSRGVIREDFNPVEIAKEYEEGGAACISVLTDSKYFQGDFEYLKEIRESGVQCPLLCKDFIVEPYQIFLARVKGADCILLIAAVLSDYDLKYLLKVANALGMAALVEVHTAEEADRVLVLEGVTLMGINNRDLGTFKVDIYNTAELLAGQRGELVREKNILVVGESGLFTPDDIAVVQRAGVGAVLVGESLVREDNPAKAIASLFGKDISRK